MLFWQLTMLKQCERSRLPFHAVLSSSTCLLSEARKTMCDEKKSVFKRPEAVLNTVGNMKLTVKRTGAVGSDLDHFFKDFNAFRTDLNPLVLD